MTNILKPRNYHYSLLKRLLDLGISLLGLVLFSPAILIIALAIKAGSKAPPFFVQKRVGKGGNVFKIIMFQTMYVGAEKDQEKYLHLNEADGPVFNIRNDPRFVGIGKFLAQTGLDELPQLVNVLKGEMSLVGPRPLPVYEAKKLTKDQKIRELVKSGITSSWVISGAHNLKFEKWMQLDKDYVENASLTSDISILLRTALLMLTSIVRQIKIKFAA